MAETALSPSERKQNGEIGREPSGRWLPGHDPGSPTKFRPGISGNPLGPPKRARKLTEMVRERLADSSPSDGFSTIGGEIVDRLLAAARAGEAWAIREVLDRTEGRVPVQHAIVGMMGIAGPMDLAAMRAVTEASIIEASIIEDT